MRTAYAAALGEECAQPDQSDVAWSWSPERYVVPIAAAAMPAGIATSDVASVKARLLAATERLA
jgi:hypothetical protein